MAEKLYTVCIRQGESGLLFARCDDLPGFHLAERTVDALRAAAPCVIETLLEAQGIHVRVNALDGQDMWVLQFSAHPVEMSTRNNDRAA